MVSNIEMKYNEERTGIFEVAFEDENNKDETE